MKSNNYQQKVCDSPLWSLNLTVANSVVTLVRSLPKVMRSHFSLTLTIYTVHNFKRLTQRRPHQQAAADMSDTNKQT